jgi:hypothetical protein
MSISQEYLETAYYGAAANWAKWREDYNHTGPWEKRPILTDETRFARFCIEYSLARNIPGGCDAKNLEEKRKHANARRKRVMEFFRNNEPRSLETLECYASKLALFANKSAIFDGVELNALEEGRSGVGKSVSLVSKVFCFSDPSSYPPIDTLNKAALGGPRSYAQFLDCFRQTHDSVLNRIRKTDWMVPPSFVAPGKHDVFWSRVTDHVLMVCGARRIARENAQ